MMLLAADHVLNRRLLTRLRDIREIHDVVDEIWVWPKEPAAGV